MKISPFYTSLAFLAYVVSMVLADAAVDTVGPRGLEAWRRTDGDSGDGFCDPCLDSCSDNKRDDLSGIPRMLHGNNTSPWEDGEGVRWRQIETTDELGHVVIGYNLEFNCLTIPDVCNNMWYGALCKTPAFSWTLTIQRDNVASCRAARKSNSCGSSNPNYCSAKTNFTSGYSCDEYPFASTKQGQSTGGAATRCVLKTENSRQGGAISGLYTRGQGSGHLADGTQFTVVLVNATSSTNCGGYKGIGTKNCSKGTTTS